MTKTIHELADDPEVKAALEKRAKQNMVLSPSEASAIRNLSKKITEAELMHGLSKEMTSEEIKRSWKDGDPETSLNGLLCRLALLEHKVDKILKELSSRTLWRFLTPSDLVHCIVGTMLPSAPSPRSKRLSERLTCERRTKLRPPRRLRRRQDRRLGLYQRVGKVSAGERSCESLRLHTPA